MSRDLETPENWINDAQDLVLRPDVAKALLRAELTAGLQDADLLSGGQPRSGYVRLLQADWERRMALQPELFVLRRDWERFQEAGQKGDNPLEAPPPPPPPDEDD